MVPELEEGELEKTLQPVVLEYFEHGDTGEVTVMWLGVCGGVVWGPSGMRTLGDGMGWGGEGSYGEGMGVPWWW